MMKRVIKFLLIIIWMGIIFWFSNDNAVESTKKSDSVIVFIANKFVKKDLTLKEKEEIIDKYVVLVRKTAHFLVYFILGVLVISYMMERGEIDKQSLLIAILICLGYACSDEIHQLFISGRSGQLLDVLLDTIGASSGIWLYQKAKKIIRQKNI